MALAALPLDHELSVKRGGRDVSTPSTDTVKGGDGL